MQWATMTDNVQILIIGVHGAWKMLALLTADHKVKSRSDLISLRW